MALLLLELVSTTIILVTKPLTLAKLSCLFGLRSICLIIQTRIEIFRAAINFQLKILWRVIIWATAILSLPVRALTALQREKMLEMRIHEMQAELENMIWHRKNLEERLQLAIKERRLVEVLLAELEEEHDEAICKMELLGGELQHLKAENLPLKEIQGKTFWSSRGQDEGDISNGQSVKDADEFGTPLLESSHNGSGVKGQDMRCKENWKDGNRGTFAMHDVEREDLEPQGPIQLSSHDTDSFYLGKSNVLEQWRELALSQSVFSATLSLLIGLIVWEAKDPCMPLVIALFIVVSTSLMSVIRFFSTIKNKPAIDAVALLSFNWFILGTLMYPILPRLANAVAPFMLSIDLL